MWIASVLAHSAAAGTSRAFSRANAAGIVALPAAERMTSAASSTHDRKLPSTATTSPALTNTRPQGPTTASSTPAIDGFASAASSARGRIA